MVNQNLFKLRFVYAKSVSRSNGQHVHLRGKARKVAPNGKDVRYHNNVIRIQKSQDRVLSRRERRAIYKRS